MITVDFAPRPRVVADIRAGPGVSVDIGDTVVVAGRVPAYDGPYTVTPAQETQTLPTAGKRLENDVVVNPIPSNYGRIEWNGVTLSVI